MERHYYTISLLDANDNLAKGIFSNKSKLFDIIDECKKSHNFTKSSFVNVFDYDKNKKVNYDNITSLLRILLPNESFVVKLSNEESSIKLEITKLIMNQNKIFI